MVVFTGVITGSTTNGTGSTASTDCGEFLLSIFVATSGISLVVCDEVDSQSGFSLSFQIKQHQNPRLMMTSITL